MAVATSFGELMKSLEEVGEKDTSTAKEMKAQVLPGSRDDGEPNKSLEQVREKDTSTAKEMKAQVLPRSCEGDADDACDEFGIPKIFKTKCFETQPIPDDLLCVHCGKVPLKVFISKCECKELYCEPCSEKLELETCKSNCHELAFRNNDVYTNEKQKQISKLTIYCIHSTCTWTGEVDKLHDHILNDRHTDGEPNKSLEQVREKDTSTAKEMKAQVLPGSCEEMKTTQSKKWFPDVKFMAEPKILEINSEYQEITHSKTGITLVIPDGAVSHRLSIAIGIVEDGQESLFDFPDNVTPITQILWISTQEDGVELEKDIQLLLPRPLRKDEFLVDSIIYAKAKQGMTPEKKYKFDMQLDKEPNISDCLLSIGCRNFSFHTFFGRPVNPPKVIDEYMLQPVWKYRRNGAPQLLLFVVYPHNQRKEFKKKLRRNPEFSNADLGIECGPTHLTLQCRNKTVTISCKIPNSDPTKEMKSLQIDISSVQRRGGGYVRSEPIDVEPNKLVEVTVELENPVIVKLRPFEFHMPSGQRVPPLAGNGDPCDILLVPVWQASEHHQLLLYAVYPCNKEEEFKKYVRRECSTNTKLNFEIGKHIRVCKKEIEFYITPFESQSHITGTENVRMNISEILTEGGGYVKCDPIDIEDEQITIHVLHVNVDPLTLDRGGHKTVLLSGFSEDEKQQFVRSVFEKYSQSRVISLHFSPECSIKYYHAQSMCQDVEYSRETKIGRISAQEIFRNHDSNSKVIEKHISITNEKADEIRRAITNNVSTSVTAGVSHFGGTVASTFGYSRQTTTTTVDRITSTLGTTIVASRLMKPNCEEMCAVELYLVTYKATMRGVEIEIPSNGKVRVLKKVGRWTMGKYISVTTLFDFGDCDSKCFPVTAPMEYSYLQPRVTKI